MVIPYSAYASWLSARLIRRIEGCRADVRSDPVEDIPSESGSCLDIRRMPGFLLVPLAKIFILVVKVGTKGAEGSLSHI